MKKLKTPEFKVKEYRQKVIYFCDPMLTLGFKNEKEEYKKLHARIFELEGIKFKNVVCTMDSMCLDDMCDIFLFDYGGMMYGNSLLESFSRTLLHLAEDRPNTSYVIMSLFTKRAMEDAIEEFGKDIPINLFLDVNTFIEYFKKYN